MQIPKTLKNTKFYNTKKAYFLLYTAVFLVVAPLIFMAFIQQDKSFVWISDGGGKDGYHQHYMAFVYLGQWLREIARTLFTEGRLEIPLWDFSIGFGADVITTFNYYSFGDPLNLISVFVPSKFAEYAYTAVVVLRVYLSGVAFSLFCFKMNKSRTATFAGTIVYAFSGYTIFNSVRHVFFMNPMIYLPLVLLGVEKIFRKEKPILFIAMVCLSAISNFYFFYMIVFIVVIYVLIRYFTMEREKNVKNFFATMGKFAGSGLLGVGLSAVVFLPVISVFLNSGRHTEAGGVDTLFYSFDYYLKMAASFFGGVSVGVHTIFAFSAPLFIAIVVMFTSRKKYTDLKIATVVFFVMISLPVFGKILNGFSYVSNRWCFAIAGLMAFVLASVWEDMFSLSKKKIIALFALAVAYAGFLIVFNNLVNVETIISVFIIFVSLVTVVLVSKVSALKSYKQMASLLMVVLVIMSAVTNGYCKYASGKNPFVNQFLKQGEAIKQIKHSSDQAASKLVDKNHFARNEQGDFTSVLNASVLTKSTGTQHYWSLENGAVSGLLFNADKNEFLPQMNNGLDGRVYLEAISSVKYFITADEEMIPYDFSNAEPLKEKYTVYKNKNALPLGYTYSSYIDYEEYEKMTSFERQRAMLQGVVLENTKKINLDNFGKTQIKYNHKEVEYSLEPNKKVVQMEDGSFVVNKDNAKMKLTFEGLDNSETYLYVEDMFAEARNEYELYMDDCQEFYSRKKFEKMSEKKQNKIIKENKKENKNSKENNKLIVKASTKNNKNRLRYFNEGFMRASGQKNFLINLGYNKEGLKEITVSFSSAGVYKFGKMAVVCQPMDDLKSLTSALKEDVMTNEKITANSVEGDITLNESKILCLSIPYSKGWTAYVDGKKTDLLQANDAFMAIALDSGEHHIQLKYFTPLMKIGIGISVISIGIFIGMAIAYSSAKRKKKSEK